MATNLIFNILAVVLCIIGLIVCFIGITEGLLTIIGLLSLVMGFCIMNFVPLYTTTNTENLYIFNNDTYCIENGGENRTLEINIENNGHIENKTLTLFQQTNVKKMYILESDEQSYIEYTIEKYIFDKGVSEATLYLPKNDIDKGVN